MKSIFSIDVEDWFHILDLPSTPGLDEWPSLQSRVERNFIKLLDILSEKEARATCFFLGWVAEKFPHLVKEAQRRGHEVASHGYSHRLVYKLGPAEFLEDAGRTKNILEDITGEPVMGYRSAGFSVTNETPWFFSALMEAGYTYDSSVFPATSSHGGIKSSEFAPYAIGNGATFMEFPITVARAFGRPICFFGGGYLRLFPYPLIKRMAKKVLAEGRPVIFFVHPREIDPKQPRLPMGALRKFKSYVNLDTTEKKIRNLLDDFEVTTFASFIAGDDKGGGDLGTR